MSANLKYTEACYLEIKKKRVINNQIFYACYGKKYLGSYDTLMFQC